MAQWHSLDVNATAIDSIPTQENEFLSLSLITRRTLQSAAHQRNVSKIILAIGSHHVKLLKKMFTELNEMRKKLSIDLKFLNNLRSTKSNVGR